MVSVSAQAVTGMRSEETEKGVCHFHDSDGCVAWAWLWCNTHTAQPC
jgi:hypothetical protein